MIYPYEHLLEKRRSAFLGTLVVIFMTGVYGCAGQDSYDRSASAETLAQINDLSISVSHFETTFKEYFYRTGQVLTADSQTRKAILDNEFNTYVLATYAVQEGLSDSDQAKLKAEAIRRRVLTEEFNAQVITKDVHVTEQELRDYFLRFNTRIRASHLYAKTQEEIQDLQRRLLAGESFEQLAKVTFQHPGLAESGGDLGWFTTDEMDISFEEAAFSLGVHEMSDPVQTAQGYSIIKVTDRVEKPLLTEHEFNQQRERLTSYVQKKKNELRTREHLKSFMESAAVDETAFNAFWEFWNANKEAVWAEDPEVIQSVGQNDTVLLTYDDFEFSARAFYTEYRISPISQQQSVRDELTFNGFLMGAAYRAYMLQEAERRDIHLQKEVQDSIEETYLHELESMAIEYLRSTIQNTPAELYTEFMATSERYAEPLYINLQRVRTENRTTAEHIHRLALSGVEFGKLVQDFTIHGEERMFNGELGYTSVHEYGIHASRLASLQEGQISDVLPYLSNEFHIYKVLGREEARQLTFYEAREWVNEVLTEKKLKVLKAKTIEQVKEQHNAFIDLDKLNALVIRI